MQCGGRVHATAGWKAAAVALDFVPVVAERAHRLARSGGAQSTFRAVDGQVGRAQRDGNTRARGFSTSRKVTRVGGMGDRKHQTL